MDNQRVILYTIFSIIIYTLWIDWKYEMQSYKISENPKIGYTQKYLHNINKKNVLNVTNNVNNLHSYSKDKIKPYFIHIKTDLLDIHIDKEYGNIFNAKLLKYPINVYNTTPVTLLSNNNIDGYLADSNFFIEKNNNIVQSIKFDKKYTNIRKYNINGRNIIKVTLFSTINNSIKIKKELFFKSGSYLILVRYIINNLGLIPIKGHLNTRFIRINPIEDKSSFLHIGSYTGGSYSNPNGHLYKKISFKSMKKHNLNVYVKKGWIAMQQHYFITAWIPYSNINNSIFYTRAENNVYSIGSMSNLIKILPNQIKKIESKLYIGPAIVNILKKISPGLHLTIDYGWLWFISIILFNIMKLLYSILGNWGYVIITITLLIKFSFYQLSESSYRSMSNMKKLQPKLQTIRNLYGNDKKKVSQLTIELYKKEKINPISGCLPILIQIPVFIALYWVLLESIELRQAPFILWIRDLSSSDPYHILPIIMGITMLIQQHYNVVSKDPVQNKIIIFLPILFTALFWNFPSGLVLYWIINNIFSILQQIHMINKYK